MEDSYGDFDLIHHLNSLDLIVVGNTVGTANSGSLAIDMRAKMCGD